MKNIARVHKALSDETRLRIVSLLLTAAELCVCDLMAVIGLPQSTVSRHLAYLRDSGLVKDRRQGVWIYYRIPDNGALAPEVLKGLRMALADNRIAAEDQLHLSEYLATKAANACA